MKTDSALPTLPGGYNYPAPTVPPNANAPYMQASKLPTNFVFIVVGAALAFVALVLLTWSLISTWLINRSFRRSAGGAGQPYTPLPDHKKTPAMQSSNEMADLSQLPRSFSNVPSLFFSPTAGAVRQVQRPSSRHLPAGHYRDASDSHR